MEKMLWPQLSLTSTSFASPSPTAPCLSPRLSRGSWSSRSLRSFAGKAEKLCSIFPFFRNISEIYDKCATNTEGKVANYIPQVSLPHSSFSSQCGFILSWRGQTLQSGQSGETSHSPSSSAFARWTGSVTLLVTATTSSAFNLLVCPSHMP